MHGQAPPPHSNLLLPEAARRGREQVSSAGARHGIGEAEPAPPPPPEPQPSARSLTTTPTRWTMGRPAEAIARATLAFALLKRGNAGCQAGVGREDQILDARA